jgi:tRNA G18 (ribose-2'-O)-methylase SpoU
MDGQAGQPTMQVQHRLIEALLEKVQELKVKNNILRGLKFPRSYLIIANISKKDNIKKMLVSAQAFKALDIIIIGQPKLDLEGVCEKAFSHTEGVHSLRFARYPTLAECRDHLHSKGVRIAGIEILEGAEDVNNEPFYGSTAFLMGNEGAGLSDKQLSVCDQLIYIPQYGGGTASLNVCVAASILLHKFAVWAEFRETVSAF